MSLLVIAAFFGVAAGLLWSWSVTLWSSGKIFYFVLPEWLLVFCGLLISGLAAAVGLICILPPMIRRIPHKRIRLLARILTSLCTAVATVIWLYFWLGSGFISIGAEYHKVTAETGESIVVSKPGFDPASYGVYTQSSAFVYEEVRGLGGMADSGHFVADYCTLVGEESELLLTCGEDAVRFLNPAK